MFLPLVAGRWMSTTRKDVGGAACHEHGAVFASAARVPLTSVASVVEMTGDFTLTLPVMLDVEIGTSRGLSYGTIYTTKLLRRGTDIDRVPPADPFQDLTAADAMRRLPAPLAAANGPSGLPGVPAAGHPALPGPVTRQRSPQVLFASESLTRPCASWNSTAATACRSSPTTVSTSRAGTSQNVLQAVARHISAAQADAAQPPRAVHAPGKILTDLVLALALGGDCLADVAVLCSQPDLARPVASDPVVSRLITALAADAPRALQATHQTLPRQPLPSCSGC